MKLPSNAAVTSWSFFTAGFILAGTTSGEWALAWTMFIIGMLVGSLLQLWTDREWDAEQRRKRDEDEEP